PSRVGASTSGCEPSLTASWAKYALQEWTNPSCSSIVPCGRVSSTSSRTGRCQPSIFAPILPSESRTQVNVVVRGSRRCRSAADAVTSLNVDPGGYNPYRARSSSASAAVSAFDAAELAGFVDAGHG